MSLFQSALDFLAGPGALGAASRDQNDFVGQTVEMGDMKLRIKRVIAEGESGRRRQQAAPGTGPGGGAPAAAGLGWASPRAPGLPRRLAPSPLYGPGGIPSRRAAPCQGWPWGGEGAAGPGRRLPAARAAGPSGGLAGSVLPL